MEKLMSFEKEEELKNLLLNFVSENNLTISNLNQVIYVVVDHMEKNATLNELTSVDSSAQVEH